MTPSEFRDQFPGGEFDNTTSLPDATIQKYLDLAAPSFNVSRWGRHYSEGLANHVAHRIVFDRARAAKGLTVDSGAVTEKHVGPVGTSFDGAILAKQVADPFLTTSYGRRYCELRQRVGRGGTTVP